VAGYSSCNPVVTPYKLLQLQGRINSEITIVHGELQEEGNNTMEWALKPGLLSIRRRERRVIDM